ncbi:hypothetical protein IQ251_15295 [Saccharopolyspora sp. HNM0983]|uniref:Uncharacterized protein n=1 Tax=Saccharopolyspora montiporae TaxID=2781240 RepID=A0A929G0P0_9PSEU|nr:hypothetical protein [Saccharopolyspora sp. HNM0983]MBE9375815.1 hypothetical protein [Saccharopolyspora sp. HNM0983]
MLTRSTSAETGAQVARTRAGHAAIGLLALGSFLPGRFLLPDRQTRRLLDLLLLLLSRCCLLRFGLLVLGGRVVQVFQDRVDDVLLVLQGVIGGTGGAGAPATARPVSMVVASRRRILPPSVVGQCGRS